MLQGLQYTHLFPRTSEDITVCMVRDGASKEEGATPSAMRIVKELKVPNGAHVESTGVYCARIDRSSGLDSVVAVKFPRRGFASIVDEVAVLAVVQGHPNIVRLWGHFEAEPPRTCTAVVMELCQGGDVTTAVSGVGPFGEDLTRQLARDLLSGLEHLHLRRVMHRDVTAEHVLLRRCGRAVLTGFHFATCLDNRETPPREQRGSPGYVAPEVLLGHEQGIAVDAFAAGVVFYFALCGNRPFTGATLESTLRRTMRCVLKFPGGGFFDDVSQDCKDVLALMLRKRPEDRGTVCEVLHGFWLAQAGPDEPEHA